MIVGVGGGGAVLDGRGGAVRDPDPLATATMSVPREGEHKMTHLDWACASSSARPWRVGKNMGLVHPLFARLI